MTTERLYLDDPHLLKFTAQVTQVRADGPRTFVALTRSAFYPEGGGQPGDRGTLGTLRVVDTQDDAGEVQHELAAGEVPPAIGAELAGEVDAARRLDHLQQHHGQHLLSAAFVKVLGAPTVSMHIGEQLCTIDLDCSVSKLDAAALRKVEAAANASVWADHEVIARKFSAEELATLDLRKQPMKGNRVILVRGVDASPCGGTHPKRTGEVGAIAVLRASKWGQGQARVEFACGVRVVRLLAEANAILAASAATLGCNPAEVGTAIARVSQEQQAKRKAVDALEKELARHEAQRLVAEHGEHPRDPLGAQAPAPIVARLPRSVAFTRAVAQLLSSQGRTALLATVEDDRGHLVFARPKGPGPQLADALKSALALLEGKGGGSPDFATGSGKPQKLDEALAHAAEAVQAQPVKAAQPDQPLRDPS
ncbi:MAG: phosphoesterase [Deltaproteobacteria bacterium]|nr:phosphoesterase [Deltaproteobacteria bacterium]